MKRLTIFASTLQGELTYPLSDQYLRTQKRLCTAPARPVILLTKEGGMHSLTAFCQQ